ncbi:hypothetical protein CRUP_004589 [Coryphaenoides rupestris]|nr:hypothetical protein CRUP_004589 [Coryphaenoides rupestris]
MQGEYASPHLRWGYGVATSATQTLSLKPLSAVSFLAAALSSSTPPPLPPPPPPPPLPWVTAKDLECFTAGGGGGREAGRWRREALRWTLQLLMRRAAALWRELRPFSRSCRASSARCNLCSSCTRDSISTCGERHHHDHNIHIHHHDMQNHHHHNHHHRRAPGPGVDEEFRDMVLPSTDTAAETGPRRFPN